MCSSAAFIRSDAWMFTTWQPIARALLMTMFWFSVISHGFSALPAVLQGGTEAREWWR